MNYESPNVKCVGLSRLVIRENEYVARKVDGLEFKLMLDAKPIPLLPVLCPLHTENVVFSERRVE